MIGEYYVSEVCLLTDKLNFKETAKYLNVSERSLTRYIKDDVLSPDIILDNGRLVKTFKKSDLDEFLKVKLNIHQTRRDKNKNSNRILYKKPTTYQTGQDQTRQDNINVQDKTNTKEKQEEFNNKNTFTNQTRQDKTEQDRTFYQK
jgi:ABC-type multidrug transport system ATPase subunit